jgi:WD40 repeat protein
MSNLTGPEHPSVEALRSFGLGNLDGDQATVIEEHLSGCEACAKTVAEARSDTFTERLRLARQGSPAEDATVAPSGMPLGQERGAITDGGPSGDAPAKPDWTALPPELVQHPRYRVLTLLGTGGMGAVYKAEHRLMERQVALKVMTSVLVGSEAGVDRFRREVKAAARLSHPNIVAAYDAEQAGGLHFLIMEYVEGTDLSRWLAQHGPLPVAEACAYGQQCAAGLQHAHEHGMIHRDIKPHNLMRTPGGTVKVLDFGLARLAAEAGSAPGSTTGQGTLLGTVDYLAPEQADDARQADIRSDIYSLGCTLYHLLSGRPPFPQGTLVQKIMAHRERQPQSLLELRPDLPPGLVRVVDRMMSKLPERRYQTPSEVCTALEPFTSRTVLVSPAAQAPRNWETRQPAGVSRRGHWIVAAAALLLGLIGLVAAVAVYRIQTDNGELVITTDNEDVEVVIKQNGKLVRIIDTKTNKEVTLRSGLYELELKGNPEDLKLSLDRVTIRRGDTVVASVARLPKPVTVNRVVEVRRFMWERGLGGMVAFSPDGKTIGWAEEPGTVHLCDVASGQEQRVLQGHRAGLRGLAFSPDGTSAATSDVDGVVKVWDLASDKERKPVGQVNQPRGLAFAPDSKLLYCGSADERLVRAWELATGKLVAEFDHGSAIRNLAVSADGKLLAVATFSDGAVKLWDARAPKEIRTIEASRETINSLAFSPDSKTLFTAGPDRVIRRWDVATGKLLSTLDGSAMPIEALALSPDGTVLISGGGNWMRPTEPGELIVWDVASAMKRHSLSMVGGCVFELAIARDGRTFATGEKLGVRLWRLPAGPQARAGEVRSFVGHTQAIIGISYAPDGRHALSTSYDMTVRLWDINTGKQVRRFDGHTAWPYHAVLSRDGKRMLSGGDDQVLRIWDAETGKELRQGQGHTRGIVSITLSADGQRALTSSWDGTVRLWNVETAEQLKVFEGHSGLVSRVVFSPDGKRALSSSADKTVRLWDLSSGKEIRTFDGHAAHVTGVAFSADGRRAVSSDIEGGIRLWDIETGKEVRPFKGPQGLVRAVAFSPNGRQVISGACPDDPSQEGERGVRVWDVETGKELHQVNAGNVGTMALSPDGRFLLVANSWHSDMRLWRLPPAAVERVGEARH